MYAIRHPSLPNYLALTGGSTFGIDSDCTDCSVPGSGIAGQLTAPGLTWKGYMEDLPHPCFTGAGAGNYAKKHDPFVYYRAIVRDPHACRNVVPLRQLASDERAGHLPTLSLDHAEPLPRHARLRSAVGDRFLRAARAAAAARARPAGTARPHVRRGLERQRLLPARVGGPHRDDPRRWARAPRGAADDTGGSLLDAPGHRGSHRAPGCAARRARARRRCGRYWGARGRRAGSLHDRV